MKKRFVVLCLLSATAAFAQSEAQPEMPSNLFFDTDIYIYEPKFRLTYGLRALSGAKSSFHGSGRVQSVQEFGSATGTNADREYHDGTVEVDSRTVAIDDGNGGSAFVLITPDGKTNNWGFGDAKQIQTDGTIAMHAYTADIVDAGPRQKNPASTYGTEIGVARDMGKIRARFDWNLAAGLSINDISSSFAAQERANITTVTDIYSLHGAPAPVPPYTSGAGGTENLVDSNGNPLLNEDGSPQTVPVDTTTLLGNEPEGRTITSTTDNTSVTNHFRLKGAYYTFRAGPTVILPLTNRVRASFSVGGALVYAGTTYSVEQDYLPETGPELTSKVASTRSRLLPGYYADASMEIWLTGRTGFYLGAVYQSTGEYEQSVNTTDASYSTNIDLNSMQGFRFGVNYRF